MEEDALNSRLSVSIYFHLWFFTLTSSDFKAQIYVHNFELQYIMY